MLTFRSKLGLGPNCSDKKVFQNLKYVEGFFMAEAKTEAYRMKRSTDYGRMMAISQSLYGQYHIWDIFG